MLHVDKYPAVISPHHICEQKQILWNHLASWQGEFSNLAPMPILAKDPPAYSRKVHCSPRPFFPDSVSSCLRWCFLPSTWRSHLLTVLAFNYTLFNKALHPNISSRCKMIRLVKGKFKLLLFLQRSRLMKL